jgi:hypothetical protein
MRISLSASAAKAAPGNKVETANIAATARREILDMVALPEALKNTLVFQYVMSRRNEKIHTADAARRAQLCQNGSESSIEPLLPYNRP